MNDSRGAHIELDDDVQLWPDHVGKVVCSFDDGHFSRDYDRDAWGHLQKGVLFLLPDGTLIHYEEPDEDLVILEKRGSRKDARLVGRR